VKYGFTRSVARIAIALGAVVIFAGIVLTAVAFFVLPQTAAWSARVPRRDEALTRAVAAVILFGAGLILGTGLIVWGQPFKPGQSGNPKGRPPGIKETLPRGAFKAAYDRVLAKHPELLDTVIRAGLQGQPKARNAVPFLELGAKLGKEIGADAQGDTRPIVFNFHTNLNPMALAPKPLPAGAARGIPVSRSSQTSKRAGAKPTGDHP